MQTNARLFTDRDLLAAAPPAAASARPALRRLPSPDADASGILEALAHTALVVILLGALLLSGRHPAVPAAHAVAPAADLTPAMANSSPAASSAVKHCL